MEIKKSELEKLYKNNSNKEVCKILGITAPTLSKYLDIAGIKKKSAPKLTIIMEE